MLVTVIKREKSAVAIGLLSILIVATTVFTGGCLKESRVAVTGINVGAEKVGVAEVTLNVTTDVENVYGVSSGITRVVLKVYDTETGLVVVEDAANSGGLGIRGAGSVLQTIVLPRKGSYRLESTAYENNKRKGRGEITVYNLERLTPENLEPGLLITDIDFLVKSLDSGWAVIQTDIYFTNERSVDNGPFFIEVKAKEMDAHLLADKQHTQIGSIRAEKTIVTSLNLTVPDQYNYVFEVLVWKGDAIVKRGEGLVSLRPGTTVDADEKFITRQIETSKFITDSDQTSMEYLPYESAAQMTGFTGPLALVLLGSVVWLFNMRRRKP
ncbi:MAG: hypothetical protein WBK88_08800 [Methanothrix sp.]